MTVRIDVLDHGFVELVEVWGRDRAIIEAARQSTQKGFIGWSCWKCPTCGLELENQQPHTSAPGVFCTNETVFDRIPRDEKLLRFLWENKHSTPFEFAGMTLKVKAPIFVFREWHRHRTQSYSEASARYAPLPDDDYVPTIDRMLLVAGGNKQAGAVAGSDALTSQSAREWLDKLGAAYALAEEVYQDGLRRGVPKEVARAIMPVGRYSQMQATTDLRNWLGFLTLRTAPNAQFEIREYANAVAKMVAESFPRTYALFAEHK